MAEAGTYKNVTNKAVWVSRTALTAVTEPETSADFLYWEVHNVVVAPGATIALTAAEAATIGTAMELQPG